MKLSACTFASSIFVLVIFFAKKYLSSHFLARCYSYHQLKLLQSEFLHEKVLSSRACITFEKLHFHNNNSQFNAYKIRYEIISHTTCFDGGYHHHQGEFLHCKLERRWYKGKSALLCTRCESPLHTICPHKAR